MKLNELFECVDTDHESGPKVQTERERESWNIRIAHEFSRNVVYYNCFGSR